MTDPTHNSAGRDVDKPKRMPLWLRLLVVISMAGNLLFAGLVAGAVLRAQSDPKVARNRMLPPQASMVIGGVVFWDLDRQERRALRRLAEGQKGSVFKKKLDDIFLYNHTYCFLYGFYGYGRFFNRPHLKT